MFGLLSSILVIWIEAHDSVLTHTQDFKFENFRNCHFPIY